MKRPQLLAAASLAAAATTTLLLVVPIQHVKGDAPANREPFKRMAKNKDGVETEVTECLKGNPNFIQRDDCFGHTVITDEETGEEVYAEVDEETGSYKSSKCGVDDEGCNPSKVGIKPGVTPDDEVVSALCGQKCRMPNESKVNKVIRKNKEKKAAKKKLEGGNESAVAEEGGGGDDEEAGGGGGGGDGDGGGDEEEGGGDGGADAGTGDDKMEGEEGEDAEDQKRLLQRRTQVDSGEDLQNTMYNLVLLLRFKDHKDRCLPSVDDVKKLFNAENGDAKVAPSGSVRDCFRYNSYMTFDLVSEVCNWCDLPQTEAYYGDNYYGMTGLLGEAIHFCLAQCEKQMGGFKKFDVDKDGTMDAIAILHSGFGSEWGGDDCYTGLHTEGRIWSHKWEMDNKWTGTSGVSVLSYHISPSLWGTCGCNIGRIGVICHETGHFFGLPDLYDGTGGVGVGTTCLMGNSWGYSGDQYYPPMMSAWSKIRLGWVDYEFLTSSGMYKLAGAATSPIVYVFVNPTNTKEYFLIENKQKHTYFDKNLPQEGINIYHIDDSAPYDAEGYPGSPNWPKEHYRIAVVQADCKFQLEKGENMGDGGDVFHGAGRNYFGPDGVGQGGKIVCPEPKTAWYSTGRFVNSGFKIYDISNSAATMSFKVTVPGSAIVSDGIGADEDPEERKSCGVVGDACTSNASCCSTPKHRCVDKGGKMVCKLMKKKKKKNKRAKKVSAGTLRRRT